MCSTERFIQLLLEDNFDELDELNKVYIAEGWSEDIDFKQIYEEIKDVDNPSVNNQLGYIYRRGFGVEKDYQKAFYYYQLSAEQGNSRAQNNLGFMYRNGFGVEKDYHKAFNYFQLSAEQGNSRAQNSLGYIYQKGLGVERDYKKALYYFQQSFNNGCKECSNWILYLMKECPKVVLEFYSENNKELEEQNKELKDKITELEYRPDGPGYHRALSDFKQLSSN